MTGVITVIVICAFLAAQAWLLLDARSGDRPRDNAARLAAIALIALGGYLLTGYFLKPWGPVASAACGLPCPVGRELNHLGCPLGQPGRHGSRQAAP